MPAGLRPLLKKGNAWVWEKEHEEDISKIKNLLTSPRIAKPFDDAKDTILLTDASRLHGLEYALVQRNRKGELSLIQCGSRSLTPTQQRYATIELECLAIVWAIQKCDYYLQQSSSGARKRTFHENEGKNNPLHIQNHLGGWENALHSLSLIHI